MNRLRFATVAFPACLLFASITTAQVVQQPVAVQQPVFEFFNTNTTVTVPDGGAALLGGVDSARFGSSSRGVPVLGKVPGVGRLFKNRAFGGEINSSRNYVRAQIIDLREMDEAILGTSASTGAGYSTTGNAIVGFEAMDVQQNATENAARFLTNNVGRRGNAGRSARDRQAIEPATPVSRARALLAKGDAALAEGKIELATRYFREAERISNAEAISPGARVADRRPQRSADRAIVLGDGG